MKVSQSLHSFETTQFLSFQRTRLGHFDEPPLSHFDDRSREKPYRGKHKGFSAAAFLWNDTTLVISTNPSLSFRRTQWGEILSQQAGRFLNRCAPFENVLVPM